jgi:hypothetical protein
MSVNEYLSENTVLIVLNLDSVCQDSRLIGQDHILQASSMVVIWRTDGLFSYDNGLLLGYARDGGCNLGCNKTVRPNIDVAAGTTHWA